MNLFKNLSIRRKLLIAFLIVALFIVAAGFLGIRAVAAVNKNAQELYDQNLKSIHLLEKISNNLLNMRCSTLMVMNKKNLNDKNLLNEIYQLDKENNESMKEYETIPNVPEELKIYKKFRIELGDYIKEREKVLNFIKYKNYEEAENQIQAMSAVRTNLFNSLNELISINLRQAKNNNYNNDVIYNNIKFAIGCFIIIEFLLAIFLGFFISKYIWNQISKELKFAEEFADGKLNGLIDIDTKDEFGLLSEKLNKAAQNNLRLIEELTETEEELKQQMDELNSMHQKLTISEERYRLAVDGANDGIWDIDIEANRIFISNRCKEILGLNSKGNIYDLSYLGAMIFGEKSKKIFASIRIQLKDNMPYYSKEFSVYTPVGESKYVLSRGKAIWNSSGNPVHMAGSLTDITDRKLWEKKIKKMAYYNPITMLPNRSYVIEKLAHKIEYIITKEKKVALFFLDMDNFKAINDSLGHLIGDKFLKVVGECFKSNLKKGDKVCHLGGDEFVFMISSGGKMENIVSFAEELISIFKKPFYIDGHEIFYVTASIGIAICPTDGIQLDDLINKADAAMYFAKNTGKNRYQFFDEKIHSNKLEKIEMKADINKALLNKEFTVFYQPKVDANTGDIIGMEALVRWRSSKNGMIPPSKFISLAEETGLIIPIGEYVLIEACRQNKAWQDSGKKSIRVSVNLSVRQLQNRNIVKTIEKVLKETGMEAQWLEVEITESVVMENFNRAIDVLYKLKNMGIKVSLDDFGTGYSSLNYLRRLPINYIKMDKSFVDGLCIGDKENMIACSLISLAHNLDVKVVAEGVETLEQFRLLKKYNCDEIQGYLFSKPLDGEEFEKLFEKERFKIVG